MRNELIRICFVDDDEDDHFLMKQIIEELFPTIMLNQFYGCEELLRFLVETPGNLPHLIFLDQNLPRLTGTECLQKLKASSRYLDIPVIIYSTGGSERDRTDAQLYGAYKYILKPKTLQEMRKLIQEIVTK